MIEYLQNAFPLRKIFDATRFALCIYSVHMCGIICTGSGMDKWVFEGAAEAFSNVLGIQVTSEHVFVVEKSPKKQAWLLDVMPENTCVLTDVKVFFITAGHIA